MIQRSKLTLLALPGLAVLALAAQLTDSSVAAPGSHAVVAADDDEEAGPLHESMEVIQKGMKGIRKMLSKPDQKDAAVKICQEMQAAALVGFQHPPKPEAVLEGDALIDFNADFRKRMLTVCSTDRRAHV